VYWDLVPRTTFEFAHRENFQHEDVDLLFNNIALRYIPVNLRLGIIKEYNQAGQYWWQDLTPQQQAIAWNAYKNALEVARRYAKAGGKIITGTDTLSTGGLALHQALQIVSKEIGLSPMEALLTVTRNPAVLHHIEAFGSVEVGKIADLIVLSKNPLDDIRNTRSIEHVVQKGVVLESFFDPNFTNPIPRPVAEHTNHLWPSPIILSTVPVMARQGDGDVQITISGSGFIPYSIATFAGAPLTTTFKDAFTLTALIPARHLERIGTFPINVANPAGPVGTVSALGQQAYATLGERDEKSNPVFFMVGFRTKGAPAGERAPSTGR
jgi:hypothetical protein